MQQPIDVTLQYNRNCKLSGLPLKKDVGFFVSVTDDKEDGLTVSIVCSDGGVEIELMQRLRRNWHDVPFNVAPGAITRLLARDELRWEDVGVFIASEVLSASGSVTFGYDTQMGESCLSVELTAPGYEGRALVPFSEWADLFDPPGKSKKK